MLVVDAEGWRQRSKEMELLFVVEEDALFVDDKDDDEYDAKVRDAVETMILWLFLVIAVAVV